MSRVNRGINNHHDLTLLSQDGQSFRISNALLQARLPTFLTVSSNGPSSSSSISTKWSGHALRVLIQWIQGVGPLDKDIAASDELREMESSLGINLGLSVRRRFACL